LKLVAFTILKVNNFWFLNNLEFSFNSQFSRMREKASLAWGAMKRIPSSSSSDLFYLLERYEMRKIWFYFYEICLQMNPLHCTLARIYPSEWEKKGSQMSFFELEEHSWVRYERGNKEFMQENSSLGTHFFAIVSASEENAREGKTVGGLRGEIYETICWKEARERPTNT
jgi:hypothetical protein